MSEIFARNNFKMWYVYSPQTGHRLLFLAAEVICLKESRISMHEGHIIKTKMFLCFPYFFHYYLCSINILLKCVSIIP